MYVRNVKVSAEYVINYGKNVWKKYLLDSIHESYRR